MQKLFTLTLIISFFVLAAKAQTKDGESIRSLLAQQTKDWNSGNVDAFMKGYWQSDSLMFIGKSGITYGWQKTLDNYKNRYPDTASMGTLDFELLQVKPLSADYYFVVGKWHLTRTIGDADGFFTLMFRKINNKWVIVTDHTS